MAQAAKGSKVRVSYTGRLEDGSIFDASEACVGWEEGTGPLEFTIGDGSVILGFNGAVIGMTPGEEKTVFIPVDQAYGAYKEELVADLERKDIPKGMMPMPGEQLEIALEEGQIIPVTVLHVTPAKVTLDANHPLAGKDLTFRIRLDELL